jgi:iron complex outermembrane recepter protein
MVLALIPGWAQPSRTGILRGIVRDPQLAAVRNAKVTVTSIQTGTQISVHTNEQGIYEFPMLAPGSYRVAVIASGFKQAEPSEITIGEAASIHDFTLALASVTETVKVVSQPSSALIITDTKVTNTITRITPAGLRHFGGAQITPYKAISALPSVDVETADAFGMTNNQSIRVRGQNYIGSTVEGISLMNQGLDPGVADRWLFDMDNLSEISLTQGGIPPELSLNPYNPGGTMDRKLLWPSVARGFMVNEYHGSEQFNRVFVRFDSGMLPSKTSLFASYSHTTADKWKGKGDARANIATVAVQQQVNPSIKIRVAASYSQPETHSYNTLTYAQARNLSVYNGYDYNKTLLNSSTQDIKYFNYNRDSYTSWTVFAIAEAALGKAGKITVKPYFERERGYILAGMGSLMGSPGIRDWQIKHDMYGVQVQYDTHLSIFDVNLGYWYSVQEPPGPPTTQKIYRPTSSGTLSFNGWAMLAKCTENHVWNTPYLALGWHGGRWSAKGQVRYVSEKLPSFLFYNGSTTVDVDYPKALQYATENKAGNATGHMMDQWLPSFGINFSASKQLGVYFNYGRNFGRAAFDNWFTYANNQAIFTAHGLTEQYMWNQVRPEISDNFDLGGHYDTKTWHVSAVAFDSISHHRGVSIADPQLGGLAYTQNIARAVSRGAEIKIAKEVRGTLDIFATASRNKFMFTQNLVASTGTVTPAKGKQVPDVPGYEAAAGLTYHYHGLALSPMGRYMGQRYGDVTDVQRIPSYATMDLDMRYTRALIAKKWPIEAGVSFFNLFNRRYIGMINVSDDTKQGAAAYYAAAPRAVMGGVRLQF